MVLYLIHFWFLIAIGDQLLQFFIQKVAYTNVFCKTLIAG